MDGHTHTHTEFIMKISLLTCKYADRLGYLRISVCIAEKNPQCSERGKQGYFLTRLLKKFPPFAFHRIQNALKLKLTETKGQKRNSKLQNIPLPLVSLAVS